MMKEIVHELNEHESSVFTRILADNYPLHDHRPQICRLAVVEFEGIRYIAATDGYMAVFMPTDQALECGDYAGIPYMVDLDDIQLCRMLTNALITPLRDCQTLKLADMDDGEKRAFAFENRKYFGPLHETDALLAHVDNEKFVFDMSKPHQVILDRAKYEFLFDAIGYVSTVCYKENCKQVVFFSGPGRGFAALMPLMPTLQVRLTTGG